MKKLLYIFVFFTISTLLFAEEKKTNCDTDIAKLKPSCNFIGSGITKLKNFSKKNKTIGQTLGIKKNNKTLKEIANENKTIDQTYRNIKEKFKKK